MSRMTGPDCVVMCNLINTYIHTYIQYSSSKIYTSRESVSPLSRLIRGFRNKYIHTHTYCGESAGTGLKVQYHGGFLLDITLYYSVDPVRLKLGNPFVQIFI